MKKFAIAVFIVIAIVVYGILHNNSNSSGTNAVNTNGGTQNSTTSAASASYKDGSYTGSAADAIYGNIQVQATVSGGKITNVQFLEYPNDRGRSVEINQYADPILAQEAVQAQNAQVDVVSGATATSEAFIQSLSSALSQAKS